MCRRGERRGSILSSPCERTDSRSARQRGETRTADDRLWVQRHAPATDGRTHDDVIDRRGVVVARAVVPNAERIVCFGAAWIYVVRKDADDLQYLQRFPL